MKGKDINLSEPVYFSTVFLTHHIAGSCYCSHLSSILVNSHPLGSVHHFINHRSWDSGRVSKLRIQSWCLIVSVVGEVFSKL